MEPEVTAPDSSQSQRDQTDLDNTQEPEPVDQAVKLAAGQDAILIKRDDNGAVLRIFLNGEASYTNTLTFNTENSDVSVHVASGDIEVQTYHAGEVPTDITAVRLLTSGNSSASIRTCDFTVFARIPDEIAVSTTVKTINLDSDDSKEITYTVDLQKIAGGEDGKDYTFKAVLPEGLSLPAGAISYDRGIIKYGELDLVSLNLPYETSFKDETLSADDNTFSFTVTAFCDEEATEADVHEITLTLYADKLVRSAEAINGEVEFTVSEASENPSAMDSALVKVVASEDEPGQGGWSVVGSAYKTVTKKFYWADNNNEAGDRPTWCTTLGETVDDAGNPCITPKLYYTLTEVDSSGQAITTFAPQQLTESNLSKVGLTAMPTVSSASGTLSINASATQAGLPSKLEEKDASGTVNRRYTVSWSLEPPTSDELPTDYTLQNIEDPTTSGGTITNPGWYFVLLDDFTVTLDVQQGTGRDLTEEEVLELLDDFTFYWNYDGMPTSNTDHNTLKNMLEGGLEASYNDHTKKLTISGLWKYSVNGNPITYSLVETADDGTGDNLSADGRLSGSELPGSLFSGTDAPLDTDDWYNIIYDNTGVSNQGNTTTEVYSGGTLRLVRGGEVEYAATKVWKDAYGQNDITAQRPNATFTLYRYFRTSGVNSASIYNGEANASVSAQLVWISGEEDTDPEGHWEIQVLDAGKNPVPLPKYDSQSGREWIYVVKEELSGYHAGNYEQVFGTVDWGGNQWIKTLDDLDEWDAQRDGNTYLYNEDTLTNLQTGTISVGATKEWRSATFQSGFDNVVVELKLQVREKDTEASWQYYQDTDGNAMVRYLFDFTAVKLTDALDGLPALEQYRGGDKTQELEYRWIETAIYGGVEAETREEVEKAIEAYNSNSSSGNIRKYDIGYVGTETENNPSGTFAVTGETRSYTVSYTGSDGTSTKITNTVQDKVSYEAIKEWHTGSTPKKITLQIFRAVTGQEFNYNEPYLKFTLDGTNSQESARIVGEKPSDAPDVDVTWGIYGYTQSGDSTDWPAVVTGLPAFDDEGRTYEYILLEQTESGNTPVYKNVETDTADYRTVVVNGGNGNGFNLLVRKVWLDNSDTPHRDPVTFTLYNKNTNQPVMKTDSKPYTITLGGEDAPGIWSSVFWIGLGEIQASTGENAIESADDVYLVETQVGTEIPGRDQGKVDHHENEDYNDAQQQTGEISFKYLYRSRNPGEPIFDVTTANHRYQVIYEAEYEGELPGGVGASFTITNRRLGYINLTVEKSWVDGRTAVLDDDGEPVNNPTLSEEIAEELGKIKNNGRELALVFRLVFDDSMGKTEEKDAGETNGDDWYITYSGPSAQTDKVCVGGEELSIYHEYDGTTRTYSTETSTEQVIIGWGKDPDDPAHPETFITSNEARFYGLPKYDSTGTAVAYSVEEIWLDVTNANNLTPPEEIDLEKLAEDNPTVYGDLYELWSGYTDPQFKWSYKNNVGNMQHTLDEQELQVTNQRGTPKDVTWTKVWKDAYTNESGLRPDLYLDIYRVVHEAVADAGGKAPSADGWTPTYERRIEYVRSSGDWVKHDNTWTLTLSNVKAFDEYGFEIYYYAVERTHQPADLYDYQAGEYSLNGSSLGTRDVPAAGAEILSKQTQQLPGDHAYDLLVLGKRADNSSEVDSIPWNSSGQPEDIGSFGSANSYPQYALLEYGTFTNTLAESYSIDGMKYWTNLPTNWTDANLPTIQFLVYRYTQSDLLNSLSTTVFSPGTLNPGNWLDTQIKDSVSGEYKTDGCTYYAAQLTVSSEQWESLKSGTGYRYLIQYNGDNTLRIDENNQLICESSIMSTPLERYNENGELYTYEIREVVQWSNDDADLENVFTISKAASGFYITNSYAPDKGSLQVKKFLYLPGETVEGTFNPSACPAVTFKLTRQVSYGEDASGNPVYEPDTSFRTRTVTLGYLEIMRVNGDPRQEMLGKVEATAHRVMELITQFFTLAKLEAGDTELERSKLNLNEVCSENILSFYELLSTQNFHIEVDIPNAPIFVMGNSDALQRILFNLISNAIRYGAEGKYLGMVLRSDEENAYIDIIDKGRGIPKEFADTIFDRLFTMEDSRNPRMQGNGLGLTIAKNLAVQLGGDITLTSQPNVKTVFTVTLKKMTY